MKLSDLPVGSLVKDTYGVGTYYNNDPIIWRVLEHGHSGDPTGSTALECRDIISLKCFDAKEPNNSDSNRKNYGNNRYLYSNLLQWLNSDVSSNWYTAQHTADQKPDSSNVWAQSGTPINPYDTEAGFLTNFSADLRNALQTVSKVTAKNTVTDGGGYETVSSKIFLLSNTEVGLANENNVAEGTIYEYYSGANNTNDRRKKNLANDAAKGNYSSATSPWYWWLRTPLSGYSFDAWFVFAAGTLSNSDAYRGYYGVVPAFCISSDLEVELDSTDNVYYIKWITVPDIKKVYAKGSDGKSKLIQDNTTKLVSWANGTDEEIAAMIDAYYNDEISLAEIQEVWSIGDTREVSLSAMAATGVGESHRAQTVEMQILDFDHDTLTTPINGHSKALISVQQKNCLRDASVSDTGGGNNTENGYMNSSNTNTGGWNSCARRTWCNNIYYNALPSVFKGLVKQVVKENNAGGGSATAGTSTNDYVWLPSEYEVFGTTDMSGRAEGTRYAWFANADANRYKLPKWSSTAVSDAWWERSPRGSGATTFCAVSGDGNAASSAASLARGLAPACSL